MSRTPRYLKVETSSIGDPAKTRGAKLGSREGLWENSIFKLGGIEVEVM